MAFPFYKQLDTMDCGPTCVQMIAKYYGQEYSLQSLREKCNIGRTGVSLLGISKAAEAIGFKTLGAKVNIKQLTEEVPLPCILHWDQGHFVVLYKINNGKAFIANPDIGLVTYKIDEFLAHWTVGNRKTGSTEGVVLILEQTESFYKEKSDLVKSGKLIDLLKYFRNYRSTLVQLLLALVLGSLLQLAFPFLTQSIVDIGINDKDIHFINVILAAQLVLFTGQLGSDLFRNWLLLYMSAKINVSILSDFVTKIMRVPISFFDIKLAGDIIQRMNDHERIETFLTGSTINTLFSLFNFFIFGIALLIYNKIIFYVYIIFSVLYIMYILFFLKKRESIEGKSMAMSSEIQGKALQLIYGIQDIRLNNAEMVKRWDWEQSQATLFNIKIKKLKIEQIQEVGAFFFNQCKNILITFYTAKLVITDQLTLGEMLSCQFIIGQLNGPLEQLIHFMQVGQDARLALNRIRDINEITDEEPLGKFQTSDYQSSYKKDIQFRNVTFCYPGTHYSVLKNINLVIPVGKVTAIVGSSGSGKTTLMKLLLKIYSPSSGQIDIGNNSFSEIAPSIWRENIGSVMQDGFIFSNSIEQNIAIADNKNSINSERLFQAIKIANLNDLILTLPNGLETKIGAEGHGLSQGQKQRVLIARAVYKNPQIIMLDEATNSLDANNELEIVTSFNDFFKGKTVIIIAHRLSTVKNADQIVVLNNGEVAEIGTHKELVKNKNVYYTLVKNQIELDY